MITKKSIEDYDLKSKRVIIRVDFNVPVKDGVIEDDNRIQKSLKTIKYASDNKAKVILLSHMGRIKEEKDLQTNSLQVVAIRLSELLFKKVLFIDKCEGEEVEEAINNMEDGDIILLENTRFEDLVGERESKNDSSLAKYWASLGDIFIDDAFAVAHRAHASNYGIASYLPNGVGFLIKEEVECLSDVLENPMHPNILVLGGAKVKDKIGVIDNLIDKVDYLIIGGAMANTFLKAKNLEVGKSVVDYEHLDYASNLLKKYSDKIILPIDVVVGDEHGNNATLKKVEEVNPSDVIYDIGDATSKLFNEYICKTKMAIVNGTMGMFEVEKYSMGTKNIFKSLLNPEKVIICGGDTASATLSLGYKDSYTLISTGGGASLEMLAGNEMPGIDVIDEK